MLGQLIRFVGVGGVATLVHIVIAMLMHGVLGTPPLQANFAGFASALLFSYIGHAHCTFRVALTPGFQFLRFVIVALIGLTISSGAVFLIDTRLELGFGPAMAAVAVLVPVTTYVALKFWVFQATAKPEQTDWLGLGVSGALALVILALFWGRMINHDTAWYLVATREWLGGAALYTGLVEVNPPLNFYFTLPAIGLADLFGISDSNGEYLALALLIFLILQWCSVIARDELGFSTARRLLLLGGLAAALTVPALKHFGQREHVMIILTLPWLLGELTATPAPLKRRISRAMVAAFGICLKPHFVLFPLMVTALLALRQRSLRPFISASNLTFLAVGLSYVGFVALLHPSYLSHIVPVAQEVYGAYGAPFNSVLHSIRVELILVALAVVVAASGGLRQWQDAALFAVVALAGLSSYVIQGTGFSYHALPFRAFAIIACYFVILRSTRPNPAAISALIVVAGLIGMNIERGFYRNYPAQEIARVAQEQGKVDSLMVLSSHVYAGPSAAIASGARWVSRYPTNWLVPGAMNRLAVTDCTRAPDSCARLQAIAAINRTDNIADIAAARPDLLVFDLSTGYFDTPGFSWADFMAEDPAWPNILNRYTKIEETNRFVFYMKRPASKP